MTHGQNIASLRTLIYLPANTSSIPGSARRGHSALRKKDAQRYGHAILMTATWLIIGIDFYPFISITATKKHGFI